MRTLFVIGGLVVLMAACAPVPPDPTRPAPTLVPSSTPRPVVDTSVFDGLPTGTTASGLPQLGNPQAPVEVREYGSYTSANSLQAYETIVIPLLPRIRDGDVRYVFVPTSPDPAGLAAAALCAGDRFWEYHAALFALARIHGGATITNSQQGDLADQLGLDRETWAACQASPATEATLAAAEAAALNQPNYSGPSTLLVNDNFMLADFVSINAIIDQLLERQTPTTPDPNDPDTPALVEVAPLTTQQLPTPIDISLPDDWAVSINDTMIVRDIDALRTIPFTLYKGPVASGTGYIAMFWGFPSLVAGNPLAAQTTGAPPQANPYTDGLRLLRLAVVEPGCNVGTDTPRSYTLADGITGTGTGWSAVDCPELPDTRGWFIATRQHNLNFLFYAYLDPIDPQGVSPAEEAARQQLQDVLASIRFRPLDTLQQEAASP